MSILTFLKHPLTRTSVLLIFGWGWLSTPVKAAWDYPTLSFVSNGLDQFWGGFFQRRGRLFVPPIIVPHAGVRPTACGPSTIAHFCPKDNTIHLNMRAMNGLAGRLGDSAAYFAIAHEYGHSVQAQLGLLGRSPLVKIELQADCLAGVFFAASKRLGVLEPGDLEEGLMTARITGDYNYGDSSHHGTPKQRQKAFLKGFRNAPSCF